MSQDAMSREPTPHPDGNQLPGGEQLLGGNQLPGEEGHLGETQLPPEERHLGQHQLPCEERHLDGDQLLKVLNALGNPHRIRIVAALAEGRNYVSALARQIGMGRPLLHMHLQRLEAAGLVVGSLELSEDGKAMRFYELAPFRYELTPETVSRAAPTLTEGEKGDGSGRPGEGKGAEQPAGNRDRDKHRTAKPGRTGRTQEERAS